MNPRTRRTSSGFRVTDQPSISACPADGRSRVASIRSVVVLPAPFGPTRPKISPGSTARSRPATASVRSYRLTRPWVSTMALISTDPRDRDVDAEADAVHPVVDVADQHGPRGRIDVVGGIGDGVPDAGREVRQPLPLPVDDVVDLHLRQAVERRRATFGRRRVGAPRRDPGSGSIWSASRSASIAPEVQGDRQLGGGELALERRRPVGDRRRAPPEVDAVGVLAEERASESTTRRADQVGAERGRRR